MTTMKLVLLTPTYLDIQYEGKMNAQSGHAIQYNLLNNSVLVPGVGRVIPEDSRLEAWLDEESTKVSLAVDSEEQLLSLYYQAKDLGYRCSLVTDNGHTEFNGKKTITMASIGPDTIENIDKLTKHLKLFRKFKKKS